MNVLHMRYAVEVARYGSLNRASEALLVAQPNLSRSIRELEIELGVALFERSARGMTLTPQGETFIRRAEEAIEQLDAIERLYRPDATPRRRFYAVIPRAAYLSDAFARFAASAQTAGVELSCREAGGEEAMNSVCGGEAQLGVLRFLSARAEAQRALLEERGLACEPLAEFEPVIVMNRACVLAQKERLSLDDLRPLLEVAGEEAVEPFERAREESHRALLPERAAQLDLLSVHPGAYLWASPQPEALLARYGLTQRPCADARARTDALIYRKRHVLSGLERQFAAAAREAANRWQ